MCNYLPKETMELSDGTLFAVCLELPPRAVFLALSEFFVAAPAWLARILRRRRRTEPCDGSREAGSRREAGSARSP